MSAKNNTPKSAASIKEKQTRDVFDLNAKNDKLSWNSDGSYPYKSKMAVVDYEQ